MAAQRKKMAYMVGKITPRAMRAMKPYVRVNDGRVFLQNWEGLASDPDELKAVCDACFEGDFSEVNFDDDIDITEVREGLMVFLQKAFGGSNQSMT